MITLSSSGRQAGKQAATNGGAGTLQRPALDSRTLLCGGNEVLIVHRGAAYVLRETRQGKLILTK